MVNGPTVFEGWGDLGGQRCEVVIRNNRRLIIITALHANHLTAITRERVSFDLACMPTINRACVGMCVSACLRLCVLGYVPASNRASERAPCELARGTARAGHEGHTMSPQLTY